MWRSEHWCLLQNLLVIALLPYGSTDCPPPRAPDGVLLDAKPPYTEGSTVYARCPGNGQIIGPVSMTCTFGMWVPPLLGHCTNDPSNFCPTPQVPDRARLTRQGPFATGDRVGIICDGGGHVIGVSSLACVFGQWAPPFFSDCSNSIRYSCEVPAPPIGITLSAHGLLPSDSTVTATCTEDMKVFVGVPTIRCVLGNWVPARFGFCLDISEIGNVVYNNGYGQVIVKFPREPLIQEMGNDQLLIKSFEGGYGIFSVKGYRGLPDSEGYNWSIQNNQIYRDGVQLPNNSGNFAIVRLTGFRRLAPYSGVSSVPDRTGVVVKNNIFYLNGVPMAEKTGSGPTGVEVTSMKTGSNAFNIASNNFLGFY
ncbi:Sushi domain protein [Trichostrongylus colubriformis]|uniref:Sushi domain protein n=1 Tax=Trichostrongylus colubriformis TaxID=6319 RepID=A0AAN8F9M3_TRICO